MARYAALPFLTTTCIIGHVTSNIGRSAPRGRRPRPLAPAFALFGSPTRSGILVLLALLGDSYPRELSRLLDAGLFAVQSAVDALEREGVISTRLIGRTRRVALNPRFYGAEELRRFLLKASAGRRELIEAAASVRRRPRRREKPL